MIHCELLYTFNSADLDDGWSSGRPDAAVSISDLIYFLQLFESGC